MFYIQQKEDPWNSIIAGAATGGFLRMRQGLGSASRSALAGGVLLALNEGAGIMVNRFFTQHHGMIMEDSLPNASNPAGYGMAQLPGQPQVNAESMKADLTSSSSWFGGFFGGAKEKGDDDGSRTKVLDSFDSTVPPSFEYK